MDRAVFAYFCYKYFKEISVCPKIRVIPSGNLSETQNFGHGMLTVCEHNINKQQRLVWCRQQLAVIKDMASEVNSRRQ